MSRPCTFNRGSYGKRILGTCSMQTFLWRAYRLYRQRPSVISGRSAAVADSTRMCARRDSLSSFQTVFFSARLYIIGTQVPGTVQVRFQNPDAVAANLRAQIIWDKRKLGQLLHNSGFVYPVVRKTRCGLYRCVSDALRFCVRKNVKHSWIFLWAY